MRPITASIIAAYAVTAGPAKQKVSGELQTLIGALATLFGASSGAFDTLLRLEASPADPVLQRALDDEITRHRAEDHPHVLIAAHALLEALQSIESDRSGRVQAFGSYIAQAVGPGAVAVVNVLAQRPDPDKALHQLPPLIADFTGRQEELDNVVREIRSRTAPIVGIFGMGGVGKTALAVAAAHRLMDQYPDAQLHIKLQTSTGALTPTQALAQLISAVQPGEALPNSEEELQARYLSLLYGKRAIVFLDNAVDHQQVSALMPPEGCLVLITSRHRLALPGLHAIKLTPLPAQDACQLVLRIAPRMDQCAGELAELCGCLPLALRASSSLVAVADDLDVPTFLETLRDERSRLERIGTEGVDIGLEATFNVSYGRLTPQVARVFERLAVFPADFFSLAEETVAEDPNHTALSTLVRQSLVEFNADTNRYRLHDLTRSFALTRLSEGDLAAAQANHAKFYCAVAEILEDQYLSEEDHDPTGWLEAFATDWPNIAVGQAWAAKHVDNNEVAADLCMGYSSVCDTLLLQTQRAQTRVAWAEASLAAARRLGLREAEGDAQHAIAQAYKDLGDPNQALDWFHRALSVARELGSRHNEAATLDAVANTWMDLGDTERAARLHGEALAIAEAIDDQDLRYKILTNLAGVFIRTSDYDEALRLLNTALDLTKSLGRRNEAAGILNSIGEVHRHLDQDDLALSCYSEALALNREYGDVTGTASVLRNLGILYRYADDDDRALSCYQEELDIRRQLGDRRSEGEVLGNIGIVYGASGDHDQAIPYFEQQLAIALDTGNRHSEGAAHSNMGNVERARGNPSAALTHFEQFLEIASTLGDRSSVCSALRKVALCHVDLGYPHLGIHYFEQALGLAKDIGNPSKIADSLDDLGQAHQANEDFAAALDSFNEALSIWEETGNARRAHQQLTRLAGVFEATGDNAKAIESLKAALEIQEAMGDEMAAGATMYELARSLRAIHQLDEALDYATSAVAQFERIGHETNRQIAQELVEQIQETGAEPGNSQERLGQFLDTLIERTVAGALGDIGARSEVTILLPDLESAGIKIQDPIISIFEGNLDPKHLLRDLDETESWIVERILRRLFADEA